MPRGFFAEGGSSQSLRCRLHAIALRLKTSLTIALDLVADPFSERSPSPWRARLRLLGGQFEFESNSRQLLRLVRIAYAGLPRHNLSAHAERFQIRLRLTSGEYSPAVQQPPMVRTHSGPGLLCGTMNASNFVVLSPTERTGLVVVSKDMLRFPYHVRYELIEFAVFTLASRALGLVPLHAACIGRAGRGLLLMGPSGAGKSTLALHCLLQGLDFLSEDAAFVQPGQLLATGIGNFLHVQRNSLGYLGATSMASRIRKSPIIRRRSGVAKFEVDLRHLQGRLAPSPLQIAGIVFLSTRSAGKHDALRSLPKREFNAKLAAAQPYAANLPMWTAFRKHVSGIPGFELRRASHPAEAAATLRRLLD